MINFRIISVFFAIIMKKAVGKTVIAILEKYPLLERKLKKSIAEKSYRGQIIISKEEENADIILSDERHFSGSGFDASKIVIASSDAIFPNDHAPKNLLLCGMHNADAITLSSIREDHAMLCIQREIEFEELKILPFETWIGFDRNYDIYKNISIGFITTLFDLYFGEEKWKQKELI